MTYRKTNGNTLVQNEVSTSFSEKIKGLVQRIFSVQKNEIAFTDDDFIQEDFGLSKNATGFFYEPPYDIFDERNPLAI